MILFLQKVGQCLCPPIILVKKIQTADQSSNMKYKITYFLPKNAINCYFFPK